MARAHVEGDGKVNADNANDAGTKRREVRERSGSARSCWASTRCCARSSCRYRLLYQSTGHDHRAAKIW